MNAARMACQDQLHQRKPARRHPDRQRECPALYQSERAEHPDGVSMLSNRELEIAELVSDGHTNRQIARTLCLSEKTVETHLARTFIKLGVSSRAGVASVVARSQALGGPPLD